MKYQFTTLACYMLLLGGIDRVVTASTKGVRGEGSSSQNLSPDLRRLQDDVLPGQCEICSRGNRDEPAMLTLQYLPDGQNSGYQDETKATCRARSYPASTSIEVSNGELVTTVSEGDVFVLSGPFDADTEFVFGADGSSCTIHTSCSVPLIGGDQIGPFFLVGGVGESGAECEVERQEPTTPPVQSPSSYIPQCEICENEYNTIVLSLTLMYISEGKESPHQGPGVATCGAGNYPLSTTISTSTQGFGYVSNGDTIVVSGGPFGANIVFTFGDGSSCTIHVSCSASLKTGDQIGPFLILGGVIAGGGSCEFGSQQPTPFPTLPPSAPPTTLPPIVPTYAPTPSPETPPPVNAPTMPVVLVTPQPTPGVTPPPTDPPTNAPVFEVTPSPSFMIVPPTPEPTDIPLSFARCTSIIECVEGENRIDVCFVLPDGSRLTQCVPRELVESALEENGGNFCGLCIPLQTESPSNAPSVEPTTMSPTLNPDLLCGTNPVIPCLGGFGLGIQFCLEVTGGESVPICVPRNGLQTVIDQGQCGLCPVVTQGPSVSPSDVLTIAPSHSPSNVPTQFPTTLSPSVIPSPVPSVSPSTGSPTSAPVTSAPSAAPTRQLNGCTNTVPCGSNGDKLVICVPSINVEFCVFPDEVQLLLPLGFCGVCPTNSPTVSPTSSPTLRPTTAAPSSTPSDQPTRIANIIPAPTPSPSSTPSQFPTPMPTTREPTLAPTGELNNCNPIVPCDSGTGDDSGVEFCLNSTVSFTLVNVCVPRARVQETLQLGNCGVCPTGMPSSSPSSLPSMSPSATPSTSPSATPSTAPSRPPTPSPTARPTDSPTIRPSEATLSPTRQLDNCLIVDFCDQDRDTIHFCLETGGVQTTICVAPARIQSLLPSGFCGVCPTVAPTTMAPSTLPSSSPLSSPSASPSSSPSTLEPTGVLNGCNPVVNCTDGDGIPGVQMCLDFSSSTGNDEDRVQSCVPVDLVQSFLSFSTCGLCPSVPTTPSPSNAPTTPSPTEAPTPFPTDSPVSPPTPVPTLSPTPSPTPAPTESPSASPSVPPSTKPSSIPSSKPSALPSPAPSVAPSNDPTIVRSVVPSPSPSAFPTVVSSSHPSDLPSQSPSSSPSYNPSVAPSSSPSEIPSLLPSEAPSTSSPSVTPSDKPSLRPTPEATTALFGCNPIQNCTGTSGAGVNMCVRLSRGGQYSSCVPENSVQQKFALNPQTTCGPCPSESPSSGPSSSPTQTPVCPLSPCSNSGVDGVNVCFSDQGSTTICLPQEAAASALLVPAHFCGVCPTPSPVVAEVSNAPSAVPTSNPTNVSSDTPSNAPSNAPTQLGSTVPSETPSNEPSNIDSMVPSPTPSAFPTDTLSDIPSFPPSEAPSNDPTVVRSIVPSPSPSTNPTNLFSESPSALPSSSPSALPSMTPSASPSNEPTVVQSVVPSPSPSTNPTNLFSESPSAPPSSSPSALPSMTPSASPSALPSMTPSASPSNEPTVVRSVVPSPSPSTNPTNLFSESPSALPSSSPSALPSMTPSASPSSAASAMPSDSPSNVPSVSPSGVPTLLASGAPSLSPSALPTSIRSQSPSTAPSSVPSLSPSMTPSAGPSQLSSERPSATPSSVPSSAPSSAPSETPSSAPSTPAPTTPAPTSSPTPAPTTPNPTPEPTTPEPTTAAPITPEPTPEPTPSPCVDDALAICVAIDFSGSVCDPFLSCNNCNCAGRGGRENPIPTRVPNTCTEGMYRSRCHTSACPTCSPELFRTQCCGNVKNIEDLTENIYNLNSNANSQFGYTTFNNKAATRITEGKSVTLDYYSNGGGGTYPERGMDRCQDWFTQSRHDGLRKVFVIISDGNPSDTSRDGETPSKDAAEKIRDPGGTDASVVSVRISNYNPNAGLLNHWATGKSTNATNTVSATFEDLSKIRDKVFAAACEKNP